MTHRKGATNGNSEAAKKLLQKPSVTIPLTIIVTVAISMGTFIYGFAQSTAETATRVEFNTEGLIAANARITRSEERIGDRIDEIKKRIEVRFDKMDDRLSQFFNSMSPTRLNR